MTNINDDNTNIKIIKIQNKNKINSELRGIRNYIFLKIKVLLGINTCVEGSHPC